MPKLQDIQWQDEITTPTSRSSSQPIQWMDEDAPSKVYGPEQSWGDYLTGMGLRTVPSIAGGALGSLAGPWGTIAGGMAGSALGETLGQWYEGEGYNPELIALEGALGSINIGGKIPGVKEGARAVAKYAGLEALSGAMQGAAGSIPRTMAEEHQVFDDSNSTGLNLPTWQRVATDTAAGGAFGGIVGGGLGAGNVKYQNYKAGKTPALEAIGSSPSYTPPIDPSGQMNLNFGEALLPRPPEIPVDMPGSDMELPFGGPEQLGFDFGAYRGPGGRMTRTGPPLRAPGPSSAPLPAPIQQSLDFGSYPTPYMGEEIPALPPIYPTPSGGPIGSSIPTQAAPSAPVESGTTQTLREAAQAAGGGRSGPHVVTLRSPDAAQTQMYIDQGYVRVPGMRSKDGFPQLVRADVAPLYQSALAGSPAAAQDAAPIPTTARPPAATPEARPEMLTAIGPNEAAAGDTVEVPSGNVDVSFIQNMKEAGYAIAGKVGNNTIFKRLLTEDEGSLSIDPEKWKEIYARLRQMLGRDPSAEELDNAVRREKPAAEPGGRVANFPEQFEPEATQGIYDTPTDPNKLQGFLGDVQETVGSEAPPLRNSAEYWWNERQKAIDVGDIPAAQYAHEKWSEKVAVDYNPEDFFSPAPAVPERIADFRESIRITNETDLNAAGETLRYWQNKALGGNTIDQEMANIAKQKYNELASGKFSTLGGLDLEAVRRANTLGPQALLGKERAIPLPEGQLELPWSRGMNEQPIDADANARQIAQAMEALTSRPQQLPEQLSMLGDLDDSIISRHLAQEDGTPPEMRDLSDYEDPSQINRMARDPVTGKAMIGANVAHTAKELTTGYNKPLPFVMVREGLQNALDAVKAFGKAGRVSISVDHGKPGIRKSGLTITDNGKGMNPDELYTVFTDLHSSGKANDPNATGGKGVGKATYMLGGDHFEVETVTVMPNGTKLKSSFSGTPPELMAGFDIKSEVVDPSTPTGTKFTTKFLNDDDWWEAENALDKILKHTRKNEATIEHKRYSWSTDNEHSLAGNPKDKPILNDVNIDGQNNKGDFYIPDSSTEGTHSGATVHVLNNGMWQFDKWMSFGEETPGVPDEITIDLRPKVKEGTVEYPFPVQRESVKDHVWSDIERTIKDAIVNPRANRKKMDLVALWQQMQPTKVPGLNRDTVFFDPGGRLTPNEMNYINNSRTVQGLQKSVDNLLNDILNKLGSIEQQRLVRTGLYMGERYTYGIHIPNPASPKLESAIFLNMFAHLLDTQDPRQAALAIVETLLHEAAHVGVDVPDRIPFQIDAADINDPRVGKYLATYLNQVQEQGGLDMGHGMPFIRRLGDIYARTGTTNAFYHADLIESALTGGGKNRGYNPEIQELLRLYSESRGRPETITDILTGTGIKSENRQPQGTGTVSGNNPANGNGDVTATGMRGDPSSAWNWKSIKQSTGWGQGRSKGQSSNGQSAQEHSFIREALAVPSAATTTMDFSAPGRQGLSQILTPEFWKAAGAMFKGLSPEGFKQIDDAIQRKPLFVRKIDLKTGKIGKSFADEIGMKLFRPASEAGPRAEATASRWLETGGNIPGISAAYRNTIGVPVRASNRAYITFLNHLNANRTEKLLNLARDMSIKAFDTGSARQGVMPWKTKFNAEEALELNPYKNLDLAREIADFVNTATGHAPLKMHVLPFRGTEVNLEGAAGFLGSMLFSPRLLASRLRMTNPSTYIMASPFVRKQYMKAAVSTAAAWFISTQLAKMAGGDDVEINDEITSADFGKIRIGDTRFDPGGGFLQFLTAYGRLYKGGSTSSASNEFHSFGAGYQAQTQEDMMERFFVNKLNPVTKFAYDVASASQYNPFHVGDRTMQLFIPLVAQDLNEIAKENPDLLPWMVPVAFGMGTQTYSKGESVSKFIDQENDWNVTGGGGIQSLMPWNLGQEY